MPGGPRKRQAIVAHPLLADAIRPLKDRSHANGDGSHQREGTVRSGTAKSSGWEARMIFRQGIEALGEQSGLYRPARCADGALAVGVVGGTGAVLAGLTDWQHTTRAPQRVGLVHAVLNIGATLLQATSLALRAAGARQAGQAIGALGYGAVSVGGYLGGDLVSQYRIGVNHAPVDGVPAGWQPVLAAADLPENELRQVEVGGVPVLLVKRAGAIHALHATCTHLGGPLPQGALVDDAVQCPWHGSRFALADGRVVAGPATFPERCLATRVRNGQVEVGPGAGLGSCAHEPVPSPALERQRSMA